MDTSHLILKNNKKSLIVTDDIYLTDKIKYVYEKNKVFGSHDLDALGITIDTIQRHVILTGAIYQKCVQITPAAYYLQVKKAIQLAKSLKGVQSIDTEKLVLSVLVVQYFES